MQANSTMIDCAFCGFDIHVKHPDINMVICPSCTNASRIFDGVTVKHTNYDFAEKIRLGRDLQELCIQNNGTREDVIGIFELDYNEASLFLFYTASPELKVYAFFEYQWYQFHLEKKVVNQLTLTKIDSGEYHSIFMNEKSYVINKETDRSIAFTGQVKIPIHKDKFTVVEHALHDQLYFSFWDNNIHLLSYLAAPLENISLNKEILHRTIEHQCKHCDRILKVENFPFSKSFVCECGSAYFIENFGNTWFLKRMQKDRVPYIPLNSTCVLDEINYKVIGHVTKQDSHSYTWEEFTLWNKAKGFLYLTTYNGNWVKLSIEKLKTHIATNRNQLQKFVYENDEEYSIFNDYKSSIIQCSGVFAGNILNDKEYVGIEYIAPPKMWAFEKPLHESVTAFKGEHIDGNTLEKAFNVAVQLPPKIEIGAIEPKKGTINMQSMFTNFLLGFFILLFTQFMTTLLAEKNVVYKGETNLYSYDSTSYKLVSPPFKITKDHSNLSIFLKGEVRNSWMENEIEIINLGTGETINTEQGVEYYFGSDGGESWSEGDTENELIISYLPKGNYQVSFTPTWDTPTNYSVTIKTDVSMYKNFWLLVLFLAIPCTIYGIYNYNIESSRWSNSIYNPYLPHE